MISNLSTIAQIYLAVEAGFEHRFSTRPSPSKGSGHCFSTHWLFTELLGCQVSESDWQFVKKHFTTPQSLKEICNLKNGLKYNHCKFSDFLYILFLNPILSQTCNTSSFVVIRVLVPCARRCSKTLSQGTVAQDFLSSMVNK